MVFKTIKFVFTTAVAIVATVIYTAFAGDNQRYSFDSNGFNVKQIDYKNNPNTINSNK